MPIIKRTFKKKRVSLGVERSKGDPIVYSAKGGVDKGSMNRARAVDPKVRKIERSSFDSYSKLQKKLDKLIDYKPKNEIEVRKKNKAISLLKEKISAIDESKATKLRQVKIDRDLAREKRQQKIIEKKLLEILNEKGHANWRTPELKLLRENVRRSRYDRLELRKAYQSFIKEKGISYSKLMHSQVQEIFQRAVDNTAKKTYSR